MRIIESSFRELYQEYLSSGLTVRDFCANQDFAVSTFYRWQKILKDKEAPDRFVPLLIGKQPNVNTGNHPDVTPECNVFVTEKNNMEFTFPNGTKLLVKGHVDLSLLKTIVHLYQWFVKI